MRLLSRILTILSYVLPLVLVAAIYMAIDLHPTVRRAGEITPGNIQSARQFLAQNDPRKPAYRTRQSLALNQQDIDLAANYLAYFYANGGARLTVRNRKIDLAASLRPPKVPVIFYFNIGAILSSDGSSLQFDELRSGQLPLPGFVGNWLIKLIGARMIGKDAYNLVDDAVKRVEIRNGQIVVGYEWPASSTGKLTAAAISAEDQERLRVYQERLALINSSPKRRNVSLAELSVALFELATFRSQQFSAVGENRAALVVLAFYVNGESLGRLLPAANSWPRPTEQIVTLNGRGDFAKHFIVSAALAASTGSPLADAVGLYKEIADSRAGSGFSFGDIAAGRAGTRFGELAAGITSAKKFQQRLSGGIAEKDIMPATADLPEFMPEAEFKRRFGGVNGVEYKKMMAEIDRRITALPLYR
jgi:hypothetical protein